MMQYHAQRVTMFAAIVVGGNRLSVGTNNINRQSFPYKDANGYRALAGIHAEMDAIRKCRKKVLQGSTIVVWGFNTKSKNVVKSRPCKACMNAILAVGIKKVLWFTKQNEKIVEKVSS